MGVSPPSPPLSGTQAMVSACPRPKKAQKSCCGGGGGGWAASSLLPGGGGDAKEEEGASKNAVGGIIGDGDQAMRLRVKVWSQPQDGGGARRRGRGPR